MEGPPARAPETSTTPIGPGVRRQLLEGHENRQALLVRRGLQLLVAPSGDVYPIGLPPRRIDLLTSITGVTFEDASATREVVERDGLALPFLSREQRVQNKRAGGRDKDRLDLQLLGEPATEPEPLTLKLSDHRAPAATTWSRAAGSARATPSAESSPPTARHRAAARAAETTPIVTTRTRAPSTRASKVNACSPR